MPFFLGVASVYFISGCINTKSVTYLSQNEVTKIPVCTIFLCNLNFLIHYFERSRHSLTLPFGKYILHILRLPLCYLHITSKYAHVVFEMKKHFLSLHLSHSLAKCTRKLSASYIRGMLLPYWIAPTYIEQYFSFSILISLSFSPSGDVNRHQ